MDVKMIANDNDGYCYIIDSDGHKLLIECGIPIIKIREKFGFNMVNCAGCLISNENSNYARCLREFHDHTFTKIWCTRGAKLKYNIQNATIICHKNKFYPGNKFIVTPLLLKNDIECFGFVIERKNQKLLYAPDISEIKHKIDGLTHLLIHTGQNQYKVSKPFKNRLSIDLIVDFIKRHHSDLSEVRLLGLSAENDDDLEFSNRIRRFTGIYVYI